MLAVLLWVGEDKEGIANGVVNEEVDGVNDGLIRFPDDKFDCDVMPEREFVWWSLLLAVVVVVVGVFELVNAFLFLNSSSL